MSTSFSYKDLEPIMLEKLKNGGKIRIMPKGTSMLPMIRQGIDEVELILPTKRLKKYDIPFYKREDGQFVLHRIVKVRKKDYVLCGDNQTQREYGITDDMIFAVVTGYIRDGEYIPVSDKKYLNYCKKHVLKQNIKGKVNELRFFVGKTLRRLKMRKGTD